VTRPCAQEGGRNICRSGAAPCSQSGGIVRAAPPSVKPCSRPHVSPATMQQQEPAHE
jgi:hypothetical protein